MSDGSMVVRGKVERLQIGARRSEMKVSGPQHLVLELLTKAQVNPRLIEMVAGLKPASIDEKVTIVWVPEAME